jgi:hypothetical protein
MDMVTVVDMGMATSIIVVMTGIKPAAGGGPQRTPQIKAARSAALICGAVPALRAAKNH